MPVAIVFVSHSEKLAEGVVELAGQMTQGSVTLLAAGGLPDGTLGTSTERVLEALQKADNPDGTLVLVDLGSAVMTAEIAIEFCNPDQRKRIFLSPAPLVEGAVLAAVEASIGSPLEKVAEVAASASQLPKGS
jgi:dihydroxyacetone kinase phosphotransfer subunit